MLSRGEIGNVGGLGVYVFILDGFWAGGREQGVTGSERLVIRVVGLSVKSGEGALRSQGRIGI